jgi:aminodeoxyfutalosine synthase
MDTLLARYHLQDIADKIYSAQRINENEALRLYHCPHLPLLGYLASITRHRLHNHTATYILNHYINYSNICILSCQFCAFARKKNTPGAFTYTIDEIVTQTLQAYNAGAREVHIVGGLHPTLPWHYYLEMLRSIKQTCPHIAIKAFTAIEILHLSQRIARIPIPDTLHALKEAGLDSLTGGGAEIFDPTIRDQICRGKETAEEWLHVHRLWHLIGGRSTCTMLYGHLETPQHRIHHLSRLRQLQDETAGFTAFIPFAFEPQNTTLAHLPRATAADDLRTIAIARIYLDNIPHITAYWISLGLPLAQIALHYGADDLHGTITQERIFHMAGAPTPQGLHPQTLANTIRQAGFTPQPRNTWYQPIPNPTPTPPLSTPPSPPSPTPPTPPP